MESQNTGEAGLANWKLWLDLNKNGIEDANEPTATTSTSGAYTFSNIVPGSYEVREVLQVGFARTLPASYATANVAPGASIASANFGDKKLMTTGTLTGKVFSDATGNGVFGTGDTGLAGWTVYLDTNNNGALNPGESNTLTSSSGAYTFANLLPGSYHVRIVPKSGYGYTGPTTGLYTDMLAAGQTLTGNFGVSNKAFISGTVFDDVNKSGKQDSGELGLSSWEIYIDANNNGVLNSGESNTLTDSKGHFTFVLPPGTYVVREIVKSGFAPTVPSSKALTITVKAGQVVANLNFGDY